MRELAVVRPGEPPVLRDVAERFRPGPGEVVAGVCAAAINPHDQKIAAALSAEQLPHPLGLEAIVEVEGSRYYANRCVPPHGTLADRTLVASAGLIPLPPGLTPEQGLVAGISGLAAWFALDKAGLAPGESVLVLGATGAVGQSAVQLAKLRGAGRVLAAGRRADVLEVLRGRGADGVVVLDGAGDADAFAAALPDGGVDVVVDTLFGEPLAAALQVLEPGGRSVTVGSSAGPTITLPSATLMGRSLLSHRNSDTTIEQKAAAYTALSDHVMAGRLVIETAVYSLSAAAEAWQAQRAGLGKRTVVLP